MNALNMQRGQTMPGLPGGNGGSSYGPNMGDPEGDAPLPGADNAMQGGAAMAEQKFRQMAPNIRKHFIDAVDPVVAQVLMEILPPEYHPLIQKAAAANGGMVAGADAGMGAPAPQMMAAAPGPQAPPTRAGGLRAPMVG